ncbi:MAG: 30S ribosomal protein S16 [Allopontixanthobacter sediminis]
MAIALRLSRGGSKKRPYYRIVAADQRAPRDGKYLEQIGTYNPLLAKDDEKRVTLNEDRARYWLSVGGQPSDRVARFLDAAGVRERAARLNPNKGKPGEKATERAEEKAEKAAAADEAAKTAEEEAKAAPAEEAAVEEAPAEEAPAEEAAPEAPAEEAAAEEAPAEEVKAEEAPAEETKTEEAPAEDAASEEKTEG